MKKIKAVIFDLDGTIANTLPLCIEAFRQAIEPLANRSVSDEEIIATFGPSEEGTVMALAPDHFDKGVSNYLYFYKDLHHLCPAPFDGILNILKTLQEKGVHIAMVTGKGKSSADISLQYFKLDGYFEIVETGSREGPRKAEGIKIILDSFTDVNKDEVIYVGDTPYDIIASRQAGIAVVAAAWAPTAQPGKMKELKPDELFYHLEDFISWLYQRI